MGHREKSRKMFFVSAAAFVISFISIVIMSLETLFNGSVFKYIFKENEKNNEEEGGRGYEEIKESAEG